MKPFKFFQKPDKIQDDWMDDMDDHILGRIVPPHNNEAEMIRTIDLMHELLNSIQELNQNTSLD